MVLSVSLWFLTVLYGSCIFFDGSWCFLGFLVVIGGSWWFLMVFGGFWWFLVVPASY